MSDKELAEFEAWATLQGLIRNAFGITGEWSGLDVARNAWQASAERSAKRIAELEAALKTMVDNFGPTPSEKVKGLAEARAAMKGGA